MTADAYDRIYRIRPHSLHPSNLVHPCPPTYRKDSYGWQFRYVLDPMALGTCRHCGERLPTPAEDGDSNRKGTETSAS